MGVGGRGDTDNREERPGRCKKKKKKKGVGESGAGVPGSWERVVLMSATVRTLKLYRHQTLAFNTRCWANQPAVRSLVASLN